MNVVKPGMRFKGRITGDVFTAVSPVVGGIWDTVCPDGVLRCRTLSDSDIYAPIPDGPTALAKCPNNFPGCFGPARGFPCAQCVLAARDRGPAQAKCPQGLSACQGPGDPFACARCNPAVNGYCENCVRPKANCNCGFAAPLTAQPPPWTCAPGCNPAAACGLAENGCKAALHLVAEAAIAERMR